MAWYTTGTITASNSTTVTGSGTAFVANARVGDALIQNGAVYQITAIASDTSLTVDRALTCSGATYMIAPVQGYMKSLADQVNTLLTAYGTLYDSNNDRLSLTDITLKNWTSNPPGTAAVPAIRRATTDTDTGPYWSADNEFSISAGGTRSASFTSTGINNSAIGATTPSTGAFSTLTTTGNATIGGNLTVNGTTVHVNSTVTDLKDPIITIGGTTDGAAPSSDDNKDRGIAFQWHNGSVAKLGFFGYDDSTGKFIFVPDATNASEVISGTAGPASFGALDCTTLTASGVITANGGEVVFDNSWAIKDNTDPTKVGNFDIGTYVATATTRTVKWQNADGTMALVGTANTECPPNSGLGTAAFSDATSFVGTSAPVTTTASSYTVSSTDTWLIVNYAGTHTLTLPTASLYPGRCITVKTITANTVVSASSNVAPSTSATAGTAILAATAGKFARLVSDGSNWVVMEAN